MKIPQETPHEFLPMYENPPFGSRCIDVENCDFLENYCSNRYELRVPFLRTKSSGIIFQNQNEKKIPIKKIGLFLHLIPPL